MKDLKKLAIFLAALAGLTVLARFGATSTDASELRPVQALVIDTEDGLVTLTADTGDTGRGANLDTAISDLRAGCAGKLFTQTAEHVIVTQKAWYLMPQVSVSGQLRPAAKLYRAAGDTKDAQGALEFLQAHPGDLTLSRARAALLLNETPEVPVLVQAEGGFRLGK